MTEFIIANALGIAMGIVVKTLVPMPFLDDPVRRGWARAWDKVTGH